MASPCTAPNPSSFLSAAVAQIVLSAPPPLALTALPPPPLISKATGLVHWENLASEVTAALAGGAEQEVTSVGRANLGLVGLLKRLAAECDSMVASMGPGAFARLPAEYSGAPVATEYIVNRATLLPQLFAMLRGGRGATGVVDDAKAGSGSGASTDASAGAGAGADAAAEVGGGGGGDAAANLAGGHARSCQQLYMQGQKPGRNDVAYDVFGVAVVMLERLLMQLWTAVSGHRGSAILREILQAEDVLRVLPPGAGPVLRTLLSPCV